MISEIGNFFLAMALGFACVQVLASFWGVGGSSYFCFRLSRYCHPELVSGSHANKIPKQVQDDSKEKRGDALCIKYITLGRVSAFIQGGFVSAAFLTLIIAFLLCDFSLLIVTLHDHTQLPWYYRLAATWGNHEGSLLLFVVILSGIGVVQAIVLHDPLIRARSLTFQGLLTGLFLIFLILTSNPFVSLPFTLPEGKSLNPLLQDRGLLIHPPLLYLGYVGFSAPFSLAMAALWGRENVTTWGKVIRPWVLFAWGALTAGITLGSWWAYYELGWGGWWFWDPVENASFMPWLAGTALLHTIQTGKLYRWSLFLSLFTFGLSLLGTFLVRSGLITSVHSFAQDPERGLFILYLLGGIMGFAFFMWAWKAPRLQSPPLLLFSRQGALLLHSLFIIVGLATLILGVLYPLWNDFMGGEKIAIGAPYFERTFIPLIIPLLILIPIGSLLREEKDSLFPLLITPLTATLSVIVLILYVLESISLWAFIGIGVAVWVMGGTMMAFAKKRLSLGPTLAHVGVAFSLLAVSVGGGFRVDEVRILGLKESLDIRGIKLTLSEVQQGKGATYLYERAILTYPGGLLTPEKRLYKPQNSLLSETAIDTNGLRDLYVILGPYQGENKWLIRASYIPLAPWIWIGGALMVLGAFLSFLKRKQFLVFFLFFLPESSFADSGISSYTHTFLYRHSRGGGNPETLLKSIILWHDMTKKQISQKDFFYMSTIRWIPASAGMTINGVEKGTRKDVLSDNHPISDFEKRAHILNQEVRCPVCLGQSIAESETEASETLKTFILEKLKAGESEDTIREKLRSLYGNEILFRPPFEGYTLFLWLAPFGLFFVLLVGFLWKGYQSWVKNEP